MKLPLSGQSPAETNPEGFVPSLTSTLYTTYSAKLLAYIHRHIPVASDAEDLLFAVFLAVVEHERELQKMFEEERKAWLWSVARNKIVDMHRRSRWHKSMPLEQVEDLLDDALPPEQLMLKSEERSNLHVHLKGLSSRQQEILFLRFVAGMRTMEIARVLHVSDDSVRKALSRILNTLRVLYAQSQGEQQ
jgi:RNA polymerase sigma factor (sigma-70 family)